MKRVWITEPLPRACVGVKELGGYAVTEVSDVFYAVIPSEKLKVFDAIIIGDARLTEESLAYADKLKVVQKFGAGYDTIALDACAKRGIYVCTMPGLNAVDVAEYTVGAIISALRGFMRMDDTARRAAWSERAILIGERLKGKVVGVIGLGKIGCEVVRLLKPFNVKVLAYDPYVNQMTVRELDVTLTDLNKLLEESDVVTIHTPLTAETRGLIGWREFALMKPSTVLVNTARGPIVDEEALYKALNKGKISGAVIDVYTQEPLQPENPLLKLKNAQLSIHTACWTRQFFEDGMKFCAENVVRVFNGEKPRNIVNRLD